MSHNDITNFKENNLAGKIKFESTGLLIILVSGFIKQKYLKF